MTHSGISPYGLKFVCSFICESYSSFYILSKHVNVNAEKTDRQQTDPHHRHGTRQTTLWESGKKKGSWFET